MKENKSTKDEITQILKDESGQTFIEFIFLLLILITLSFGLIAGFSNGIGERWVALVQTIAKPTNDTVELR